jgi:thymidylate synthase
MASPSRADLRAPAPSPAPADNPADLSYLAAVRGVLDAGAPAPSRAGPVRKLVGLQVRAPVGGAAGFPLLTSKSVPFSAVAVELLWFLRGGTDAAWLDARGVKIWNADAARHGATDLGPIYGKQWRGWEIEAPRAPSPHAAFSHAAGCHLFDQVGAVLAGLRADPYSRRHLVSAWNVGDVPAMALPPCHFAWQVVASPPSPPAGGAGPLLSMVVSMRTGDLGLGIPFNLASYALLLELVARDVGGRAAEVVVNIADAHVYDAHADALREQLTRPTFRAPRLAIPDEIRSVADFAALGDLPAAGLKRTFAGWLRGYAHAGRLAMPLLVGDP